MSADLTELARAELEADMHKALTRAYRHGVRFGVAKGQAHPSASPGHEARTATPPEILTADVDQVLKRADEYASRLAAESVSSALDQRARERRLAAAEASAIEHAEQHAHAGSERRRTDARAEHSPATLPASERTGRAT